MAAFYPTSSAQVDVSSTPYINDNLMKRINPASSAVSIPEISHETSLSAHSCVEIPNMAGRSEMMFIPPTGNAMSMQNISGQSNTTTADTVPHQLALRSQFSIIDGERNLHGLSLSLSTHMSAAVPPSSFQLQFSNTGLSPVLSTHMLLSGENGSRPGTSNVDEASQREDSRDSSYGSYDIHGDGRNSIRFGAPSTLQYASDPNTVGYNAYQYQQAGTVSTLLKSRYLKAAQQLLDEVVNVREALKQYESRKSQLNKADEGSSESKEKTFPASDAHESTTASSQEISASECQDLQNKLDKLLSMSDEVDRRYKEYYKQMQILVSSLDTVAGGGAAKPYTALALKAISRHFRCLRDAISGQIQATRKSLGEQGGVIPRLRRVDQQLRQQRNLQQFGMMRDAWRPQRGLPENAVTILRAWLFEHFLHPYPKDSEKIMLARQTGLTRSQVANWFINARVRLWKPMVEEMYKEEFEDSDLNSKSSPENASKAAGDKSWASDDRREDLQESLASMADSGYPGPSHDEFNASFNHHTTEMNQSSERASMMMGPHGGNVKHRRLMETQDDHQPLLGQPWIFPT